MQINSLFACLVRILHYICCANIGGISAMKSKNFVSCFALRSICTIFAVQTGNHEKND